jgi:hypothetical protein
MSTPDNSTGNDWESFVSEAFPRAVGAELAALCRPMRPTGDALVIEVSNGPVSHQLAFMEREIVRAAESLGISRIRIRRDVSPIAVQFWKTAPDVLLLDELNTATPIGATYEFIGVFVYEPENEKPRHAVYLRLLYSLKEHTGDEAWNGSWSDHYAAFAARINDSWSNTGGYHIVAFKTFSDVRERLTDDEQRALPRESQHRIDSTIAIGASR